MSIKNLFENQHTQRFIDAVVPLFNLFLGCIINLPAQDIFGYFGILQLCEFLFVGNVITVGTQYFYGFRDYKNS